MEIRTNEKKVLSKKPKKETFWADEPIRAKLAEIPEGEKSTIIRMALREWFGIVPGKPLEAASKQACPQWNPVEASVKMEPSGIQTLVEPSVSTTEHSAKRHSRFGERVRNLRN